MTSEAHPGWPRGPEAFDHFSEDLFRLACAQAEAVLRCPHRAEDAVVDAFLRAQAAFDRFDQSRRFYPWFRRILHNCCIDQIRRGRSRPERRLGTTTAENLARREAYPNEFFRDRIEEEEALARIEERVAMIDPESLDLFILINRFDLSLAEASRLIDDGSSAAEQRHRRAYSKLLEELRHIVPRLV